MIQSKKVLIRCDGNDLSGQLFSPLIKKVEAGVLFLHGGGKSIGGDVFIPWQKFLSLNGVSSLSFDFRGVGKSDGNFEEGSLDKRLTDANAALDFFLKSKTVNKNRLFICGISMGAHIAIRLIEKLPYFKGIILEGAAAYSKEAEHKKLNFEFSEIIRQADSWVDSPAFNILETSSLPLLAFYGQNDNVVPEGIKLRYKEYTSFGNFILFPNVDHSFIRGDSSLNKETCKKMFEKSLQFIKQC